MRPSPLQITYQRNMVSGMVVAALLSIGLAFWIITLDDQSVQTRRMESAAFTIENIIISDTSMIIHEDHPAKTILARMNPFADEHIGFLGFTNLRPRKDMPILPLNPPLVMTTDPEQATEAFPEVTSFSLTPGDDTGIYIPYGYILDPSRIASLSKNTDSRFVDHPCTVLTKVDPQYPYVAQDAGKEGQVTVVVSLDDEGHMTSLPADMAQEFADRGCRIHAVQYEVSASMSRTVEVAVIKEAPPDWFFAANLLKVISEWRFDPWVVDGTPVSSFMTISYQYRLSGSSGYQIFQSLR